MDQNQMALFQTVCFLASMQHGKRLIMKAPRYIKEKLMTTKDLVGAWNMLDRETQSLVCDWCNKWHFPIAECLEEISRIQVSL